MAESSEPIEQAILLSQQMLRAAEIENWQSFTQTETARQKWIQQINSQQFTAAESAGTAQKLSQLINLNQQLEKICQQQKHLAISKIQEMNQSNRATKAYKSS